MQASYYIKTIKTETVKMISTISGSGNTKSSYEMGFKNVGNLMSGSYLKDATFEPLLESNEPKYEQD